LSERAPWFSDGAPSLDWGNVIQFERRLVRQFGKGRVWLAGDAAHVTSPLGGQSMNVGLLEGYELAGHIAGAIASGQGPSALEFYGAERQREWHKLLGVNTSFELRPHAPAWLAQHARRLVPALPASGRDLNTILGQLGLHLT
jgi:2-polyprenyl-6-methoxyphenol hydroxylase-like FAD-dependent oxidoreductase